MAKKKKKIDDTKYKVFAFMSGPHALLLVGQDGFRLDEIEIESGDVEVAKLRLENVELNQQITAQLGTGAFSLVWVDDPAGDDAVIEACRLMETEPGKPEAVSTATEPNAGGQIEIHSKGLVFQTMIDGVYKNAAVSLLQIDDICRFCPESEMIGAFKVGEPFKEFRIVATPHSMGTEDDPDYLVMMREYRGEPIPGKTKPVTPPNFQPAGTTKSIEVPVEETFSEKRLKDMIRELQTMKINAQMDASVRRDEIKAQEKAIFAACDGKSLKPMECSVENDWENAVRRYIRPDTGDVALEEPIPYDERQQALPLDQEQGDGAACDGDGAAAGDPVEQAEEAVETGAEEQAE